MRKLALVSIISLLVVGLLSWGVFAAKVDVWTTEDDQLTDLARAYTDDQVTGNCNFSEWTVNWTTHASVAQWVDFKFDGTTWNWYIRKPGDYYANCITLSGSSNGDVLFTFEGFEDLQYQEEGGVKQTIDTYYYASPTQPTDPEVWIRAADLNDFRWVIEDNEDLHDGDSIKLWNRLVVENCNSACEYEDTGVVTITLMNQKDWIDGETGTYQESGWSSGGWNPPKEG